MKRRLILVPVGLAVGALGVGAVRMRRVNLRPPGPAAVAGVTARISMPLDVAEAAYDGKLGAGWQSWGWGSNSIPATPGPARVVFSGFGNIQLRHSPLNARYSALAFRYKVPDDWPEFLAVTLKLGGDAQMHLPTVAVEARHVAKLPEGWREVVIPWLELNPSNLPIEGLSIGARRMVGSDSVYIDKIALIRADGNTPAGSIPSREVELAVRCEGSTHTISPLIYGASGADPSAGISAVRVGGNTMTRLNWDLGNAWNAGNDWFFENIQGASGLPDWLSAAAAHSTPVALTVPMIGWVAKDGTSAGFPLTKFPRQRKHDPGRPNAGDGFSPDAKPLTPGSPTETSVPAPPETIARWITNVRDQDRARGQRSVLMYLLDNEPSLWNSTHRDVHPEPLSYDELLERTIKYASAIRSADPEVPIAGPTEWGWTGYFYSGRDREAGTWLHADRRLHGDVALIPWYLRQLRQYEKDHGKRLLDILDVHFYPAAEGVYGPNARTDVDGAALRLRSTRALWDPGYLDESWISQNVSLIPMLKDWVAKNYPGLKISIGEWSFGADNHISGALATVEALGRFGQQGLDSAFYWDGPKLGTKTFSAFRAFRNFDGQGGRFLDTSLPTREEEKVSLFASRDDANDRIVAIVVNRDPNYQVQANIVLNGCGQRVSHRMWEYDGASVDLQEKMTSVGTGQSVAATLPPYSFAVLDIKLKGGSESAH